MWTLLLAASLALPGDTVQVRPGDVLVAPNLGGDVLVEGTDDGIAEVVSADGNFRIVRRGSELRLVTDSRWDELTDIHLRIPRGVELRLGGMDAEVVVEGMRGGVEVDLTEGDVRLSDLEGPIRVATFAGDIGVMDARGRTALSTMDGEIEVRGLRGDLRIDAVDGDITLVDARGADIHAETVDGDVYFDGVVAPEGQLTLVTHDGDVTAHVPDDFGAAVEVGTFDGNFESDFSVRVRSVMSDRALRFELGDGSRRVALRSFDGDIRLLRR